MTVPIVSGPDRQRVLDAALPLQMVRNRLCADWERGLPADVDVELLPSRGDAQERVWELCLGSRQLVAVSHPDLNGVDVYRQAHRVNEAMVAAGVRMTSLFDIPAGPTPVTELILRSPEMPYYLGYGPMKLKVFNQRTVLVEGPYVDGSRSLMLISRTDAVAAAMHYVEAVKSCAVAVRDLVADHVDLTQRQHTIARLLLEVSTDQAIARILDVSVRTVRSDIAAFTQALGAPNRFAAGARYSVLANTNRAFYEAALRAHESLDLAELGWR
jgi:DNA-binding CsgD family transcriptional regulator